jgi:hypothetical protein
MVSWLNAVRFQSQFGLAKGRPYSSEIRTQLPSILSYFLGIELHCHLVQSTGRVSTSAKNRVSLAILLAAGHFQTNPKTQITAFHHVVTYVAR